MGKRLAPEADVPVYKDSYYKQKVKSLEEILTKYGFGFDPLTLPESENDYLTYEDEVAWIKEATRARRYQKDEEQGAVTGRENISVFIHATNDLNVSDKIFHIYIVEKENFYGDPETIGKCCYEENLQYVFSTNSVELIEALILSNFDIATS